MIKTSFAISYLCILLICFCCCQRPEHSKKEIESAMKHYDSMILKLNVDSIAMVYTVDGNLGDIAIGRDSIKKFLSTFKNIKVLSQESRTTSVKIILDSAIQEGTYFQKDVISGKDTVTVKGLFKAIWKWDGISQWKLKHMSTKSL